MHGIPSYKGQNIIQNSLTQVTRTQQNTERKQENQKILKEMEINAIKIFP